MIRSAVIRESLESIPESLPDDFETESENATPSEDEHSDNNEEDANSTSGGSSEESFESYHEDDDKKNNNNQNKSRLQSPKSNILSGKPSALQLPKPKLPNGTSSTAYPRNNVSKIPRKKEPKFEENPRLPSNRLKQLLESDLIFFQENEVKDIKKLKELNKALIDNLKVFHKYGIQVLEEEYREEKRRERENRERERKDRESAEKERNARREEDRRKNFEEWKKQKQEKKLTVESISRPRLFSEEIARLQNLIGEKDVEIKNLKDEIRSLNSVQRRQARALKDIDCERELLPKQINSYYEELMQAKEKARLLQIQADKDRKTITQQHEQLETLKAKVQREDQPEESESTMNEIEEKKKRLEEMERKFAILMKAKESESKKHKQQTKTLEAELQKFTTSQAVKTPRRTASASSLSSPSKIPVKRKPS